MQPLTPLQIGLAAVAGGALLWVFWPEKAQAKRRLSSALLVGDSLAVGLGAPLEKELSPAKLVTRAYVSATAADWAKGKYSPELGPLLQQKPDVTLISLGTNDTVPPAGQLALDFPQNLKTIADAVRKAGSEPVLLITNLPWSTQRMEEGAALAGTRVFRVAGVTHASDSIHLTSTGYATWAKLVANDLRGSSTVGHPAECFLP